MTTLRFEPLNKGHIPAILEIEKVANTAPWSEQSFLNELDNPQSIFLVAFVDGKVNGYGGVWMVIDEAHITTVAVSPELQRKGIGRKLMHELLKRSIDNGMTCSTLEVRASNQSAIRLYETLGYESCARRKGYYPDNKEDAVVMWLFDIHKWKA